MENNIPEKPIPEKFVQFENLVVTSVMTDKRLAQAYLRMEDEGLLPVVFYERVPTLKEFIDDHLIPGKRIVLGCFRVNNPDEEPELCGLGWAMNAIQMGRHTRAECGMMFFHRQQAERRIRKGHNLLFGRLMLRMFFDQHKIDVIFGTTPEANQLALRYSQALGFTLVGPVPDLCCWKGELAPGWISHMNRQQWMDRGR